MEGVCVHQACQALTCRWSGLATTVDEGQIRRAAMLIHGGMQRHVRLRMGEGGLQVLLLVDVSVVS